MSHLGTPFGLIASLVYCQFVTYGGFRMPCRLLDCRSFVNTSSKRATGIAGCVIAIIIITLSLQEAGVRAAKEKSAEKARRATHGEEISPSSEALE